LPGAGRAGRYCAPASGATGRRRRRSSPGRTKRAAAAYIEHGLGPSGAHMADRTMIDDLPLHVAGLRRYALALTGSRFEAEDLVQETLTRAIAAASGFRKGGNLRGWLFTIMHNAFISGVRARRAAERELDDGRPELSQAPTQLDRLEVRDVLAGLARLPEAQRAALVLIALEEFSYSEAARVLGVPLGTLMSRLARGREALRRAMSEDAPPRLRVIGDGE